MEENKSVRIPSLDAKDLYLADHLITPSPDGYNLTRKDGTVNLRRFVNVLDYSLDLIKIRQVYATQYRNKQFSFMVNGYEYTTRVINVTFKYSVKQFNLVGSNIYVKNGYRLADQSLLKDCVYFENGKLIALQVDTPIKDEENDFVPLDSDVLGKVFKYDSEEKCYRIRRNDTLINVADLRKELYSNGFYCNGIHYVRFKRSSGSSRVGKCLFIDEKLYPSMHRYDMCGIKVKRGQQIDLAALEAYIALTLSSIIGTIEIPPESILITDDYDSTFQDTVVATRAVDGKLVTDEETATITNSIWDGQSLIDSSLMGEYSEHGMVLLRTHFFKSCAFNTNIQQFFQDQGITSVDQLNGFTLATDISQVKFITTPNSVKYLKFGTARKWLKSIDSTFGVVKYEKKTHFFGGEKVQTHYQLLNTLQLSYEDMQKFLKPSLDYVDLIKTDPAAFRYHIHYSDDENLHFSQYDTRNDIIFKLMGLNEEFPKTKIYRNFCNNAVQAYKENMLYGHVLVDGNYSVLCGNPLEMLKQSIGRFDGSTSLGVGNVHSKRFKYGERLLGSRSPHVCVGNILLTNNVANEDIDKYFNFTNEIVCINSINENILQRLSGADVDSDIILLTNDSLLVSTAEKNYDKFKVSTSLVESTKTKRYYTPEQQADLDIKTSVNKIGEIVNLSQELQTLMWHKLNNGADFEDVREIYYDACQLNAMSGIEIDMAKKEFDISNGDELRRLRAKWTRKDDKGRNIKPYFFGHVDKTKGYYNEERKNYIKHDTSMDYLREIIEKHREPPFEGEAQPISSILVPKYDINLENRKQIKNIIHKIRNFKKTSYYIWSSYAEDDMKYQLYLEAENDMINEINAYNVNQYTLYSLLCRLDKEYMSDFTFKILFNIGNKAAYDLIKKSQSSIYILEENLEGDVKIFSKNYKKIPLLYTKDF